MTIARGIAQVKRQQSLSIRDRQREQEILDKVALSAKREGLNPEMARRIFEAIIELSAEAETRP